MILLLILLSINGLTIEFVEEDGCHDIYFDPMANAALNENGYTLFEFTNPLGNRAYWNDEELRCTPLPRHRNYYNDRYEAIGQDIDGVFYIQAELPKPPWYTTKAAKLILFGIVCLRVGFGIRDVMQ